MMEEAKTIDVADVQPKAITAQDVLDLVRNGMVNAPVGTKTFVCLWVTPEGKLEMGGTADPNHAVALAYQLMKQVFERGSDGAAN